VLRLPDLDQQRNPAQVEQSVGLSAAERASTLEQAFQTASPGALSPNDTPDSTIGDAAEPEGGLTEGHLSSLPELGAGEPDSSGEEDVTVGLGTRISHLSHTGSSSTEEEVQLASVPATNSTARRRRIGGNVQVSNRRRHRSDSMKLFVLPPNHPSMTPIGTMDDLSPSFLPQGGKNVVTVDVFENRMHAPDDNQPDVDLGGYITTLRSDEESQPSDSSGQAAQGSPIESPAMAPAVTLAKRPAESDANKPVARKRRLNRTRGMDAAAAPPSPTADLSITSIDFDLKCEITHYREVQENAFKHKGLKNEEKGIVKELFAFYTNLGTMAQALRLLGEICSTETQFLDLGSVTVRNSDPAMAETQTGGLSVVKRASLWAHTTLQRTSKLRGQIALREVMAKVTLHLVHTNIIVPMWEQRSTEEVANGARETMWEFYYNILGGEKALGIKVRILQERIRYGRALFTLAQSIGAPALLMIAAGERRASAMARDLRKYGQVTKDLTAALSTSAVWWCFTHVVGHLTVARLFGATWPSVNGGQLAYWMRSQPLPAEDLRRWEAVCDKKELRLESSIPPNCLRLVPKENYPTVAVRWLNCSLQIKPMMQRVAVSRANKVEDLGTWLRDLEPEEQVEISSGQTLILHVLRDLLPGRVITPRLMDFFCALHNASSLDGYKVLDSALGRVLLGQPTPHTGLDKLREAVGEEVWGKECREILAAIPGHNGILGIQISVGEKCVFLYNWTGGVPGEELQAEGIDVSYTPSLLKLQHELILTIYQVVRRCIPAIGWTVNVVPVLLEQLVRTQRESALSFLHFSRSLITGSRCQLYIPRLEGAATIDEITRGLLVDGFALCMGDDWRVHPSYWFGLSPSNK